MSTRYWIIVKRLDGKFARSFVKSSDDPDYIGAMLIVDYTDQANAEGASREDERVEVFADLQSAWHYFRGIDFVFVWRDGKWLWTTPENGPERLVEMTRENQPLIWEWEGRTAAEKESDKKIVEEFWHKADADRKVLEDAWAKLDVNASKAQRLQLWADVIPQLKLVENKRYAEFEKRHAADPYVD